MAKNVFSGTYASRPRNGSQPEGRGFSSMAVVLMNEPGFVGICGRYVYIHSGSHRKTIRRKNNININVHTHTRAYRIFVQTASWVGRHHRRGVISIFFACVE